MFINIPIWTGICRGWRGRDTYDYYLHFVFPHLLRIESSSPPALQPHTATRLASGTRLASTGQRWYPHLKSAICRNQEYFLIIINRWVPKTANHRTRKHNPEARILFFQSILRLAYRDLLILLIGRRCYWLLHASTLFLQHSKCYPCSKYYGRLVAAVLQCCVLQGDGGARECGGCAAPAAAADYKTGRAEAAAISFPATMRTLVAALCLGENYLDICIDRYI